MLWWFAQTTLVVAGLSVVATLAGRWKRLGPEARHALWLVVLIKFAIPPVVAWPWSLPDAWPVPARLAWAPPAQAAPPVVWPDLPPLADFPDIPGLPAETEPHPDRTADAPVPAGAAPMVGISDRKPTERAPGAWDPRSAIPRVILGVWLVGSVAVVALRVVRVVRFRRKLAGSRAAPAWLVEEGRAIGHRLGIRPPPIVATSGVGTPMLWCLGRPRLILPEALIARLEADRWPGILAHEMAHLRRRDHWVIRLELVAESIWWWNPLFWHARSRLHDEAERACDARVVRALPGRRLAYAEALVDVCEHLARSAIPSPALGVGGAGASRSLEGRLLMILREPIPRRPSRRSALAAALLAALSLPAWTLGQQPDPPRPETAPRPAQPETAPRPAQPETAPRPAQPETAPRPAQPQALPPTTDDPPAGSSKPTSLAADPPVPSGASSLSIDAVREGFQKRRSALTNLSMRMVVSGRQDGSKSGPRRREVQVQVTDVIYDRYRGSRIDSFEARGDQPRPGDSPLAVVPWTRRLEIRSQDDIKSLKVASSWTGPVPLHWRSLGAGGGGMGGGGMGGGGMGGGGIFGGGMGGLRGGSLVAMSLEQDNFFISDQPDRVPGAIPPGRRPLAALDFDGPLNWIMEPNRVQASPAGVETIQGHEAVRMAWIDRQYAGARGLCWLAPGLGFAALRIEAVMMPGAVADGTPASSSRRIWRKSAEDFVREGEIWLPRKVTTRETVIGPDGQPTADREQVATLEDYRVNLPPEDDALFRIKLPIQKLDEATGDFTTLPPEPPAGLLDRLKRAVAESPFGPPGERTMAVENRESAATPRVAPTPRPMTPARRGADPKAADVRPDRARSTTPEADLPRTRGVVPGDDALSIADRNDREARDVAQVAELADRIAAKAAELQKVEAHRIAAKAAELQKAEAQRNHASAVVARNARLQARSPNLVSEEEVSKAEAELKMAEAEIAMKKADLDGANVALSRAKLRPGTPETPRSAPPDAAPAPGSTLAEYRDAVELMEVQLQGKQAELRGAESKVGFARSAFDRARTLAEKKMTSREETEIAEAGFKAAEAQFDQKKAEVQEFEVRLRQAKRRVEAEEARLRREISRAKAELDRVEAQFKNGTIGIKQHEAARDRFDDLMIQLDPKHVPGAATDPRLQKR